MFGVPLFLSSASGGRLKANSSLKKPHQLSLLRKRARVANRFHFRDDQIQFFIFGVEVRRTRTPRGSIVNNELAAESILL